MINGFNRNQFIIKGQINNNSFSTSFGKNSMNIEEVTKSSFKDTLSNIATTFNNELEAPDKLMTEVISGSGNADIHDVTTAIAKAEMTVSLATQVTSKIIAAYEKISQISV